MLLKLLPDLEELLLLNSSLFRTFTQVSVQWQDTDSLREEMDDLQVLECFVIIKTA